MVFVSGMHRVQRAGGGGEGSLSLCHGESVVVERILLGGTGVYAHPPFNVHLPASTRIFGPQGRM